MCVVGTRSFIMEDADLLYVAGVARRVILVQIVGEVCEFVSIVAKGATSECFVLFSCLGRCWILHPSMAAPDGRRGTVGVSETEI